ncbi:MAG TPA: hypothetical protein DEH22_17665 [Chloroflexi bacterium]|nr:hypothetical protein [Chloroflexota bacterium]
MVYLTLGNGITHDAREVAGLLKEKGVLVGVTGKRRFRLVTHYWIDDKAVQQTVAAFEEVLQAQS